MTQKLWTRPFIMIMGINFLIFLSFNMINPSLPLYLQDLGISETMTGVCISIFTVGSMLIRPIAGDVLDHFGRRSVFFISMILLAILVFCYSFTSAIALLLVLNILAGELEPDEGHVIRKAPVSYFKQFREDVAHVDPEQCRKLGLSGNTPLTHPSGPFSISWGAAMLCIPMHRSISPLQSPAHWPPFSAPV